MPTFHGDVRCTILRHETVSAYELGRLCFVLSASRYVTP